MVASKSYLEQFPDSVLQRFLSGLEDVAYGGKGNTDHDTRIWVLTNVLPFIYLPGGRIEHDFLDLLEDYYSAHPDEIPD